MTSSDRMRLLPCQVEVARGTFWTLGNRLRQISDDLQCASIFLITDDNVLSHLGNEIQRQLKIAKLPVSMHSVLPGEKSKTLETAMAVWQTMHRESVKRRTLVVVIGGGVVSDIAGFASANYLRGLPMVLVPTTLLAQVDAAIGGKNGVAYLGKKNRIGTFHDPELVLVDPDLLKTLSREQMAEGFAEALKIAYLDSSDAVDELRAVALVSEWAEHPNLEAIIGNCIERKLQLIQGDPHESQVLERALNLGHCFGHPYEEAKGFEVGHGSAVAVGLRLAFELGVLRGIATTDSRKQFVACLQEFALPYSISVGDVEATWSRLQNVREVRNGALQPVLPIAPGSWLFGEDVTRPEWLAVCREAAPRE